MRSFRLAGAAGALGFLLTACTSVFYQPDRILYYPPKKLGFSHREVRFPSVDGTLLVGWFFPAQGRAKGTLVQFHGNAENLSSHYTSLVWLTRRGYNLFTFDYRGYGGSEGEPSQEGTYLDGMAALDKAWELRSGRRFVVYGQSLGGAVAMRAFHDFRHRSETGLVVLDSTFASYKTVARRILASRWFLWPFSPLGCVLVSDRYSPERALTENKARLLVVADEHDPAVPFENSEEVYRLAGGQKEFWKLDQGAHIGVFAPYNTAHRERFVKLLESL